MDRLSSELLGFAPDARVLILNCDDFGMHDAINGAVIDAIENGVASSCTLMAPCPAAPDAIRLLRERPHIPFGIHIALIRDKPDYRWGPVADKSEVPSLLDPDTNELYVDTEAGCAALVKSAELSQVEREMRAQIDVVVDAGLAPTHLDWHCLPAGAGRADILNLALSLADEYGVAVRVWEEDGRRLCRAQNRPVVDRPGLDSYTVNVDEKAAIYERMLRELPAGLNEWAVHPGHGTPAWQAIETPWRVRQTDHAFLTSARAREVLDQEGIIVIDYRLLQEAWMTA
ncbi:MAG: carbohydrate deacetylase [Acidimicrobiales bacterium]